MIGIMSRGIGQVTRVIACKVGMIFDSNKFNQLSLGCFLNVFHSVFNMLNLLGLIFTCDCPGQVTQEEYRMIH